MFTLDKLELGQSAVITTVGGEGALRQHFLDMGMIPGTEVTLVQYAPMGDPMELMLHGYELTLRLADAAKIELAPLDTQRQIPAEPETEIEPLQKVEHPGLGEGGKYHNKAEEHPVGKEEILTFALAGNQNCGKTTLFNQLTGANQHVGNFPGVTVSRKDGVIRGHANTLITDLPGIYSMSPYSSEEMVTRQFILEEKPKAIINIVDATNIERNLYLTMQLMELNVPMVLALNMMDEVYNNGGSILINTMESLLGIPVVPISAAKNQGIEELVAHALHVARYQEPPKRQDFCSDKDHGGAVHRCLHAICHTIEDHAQRAGLPVKFTASKIVEGDQQLLDQLQLEPLEKEIIEHLIRQMEEERGLDHAAAMAEMRFSFIQRVCRQTVQKPHVSKERERSRKIDSILTGKYTAIPTFVLIMGLVFWLTFNVIGDYFQGLLEDGIDALTEMADAFLVANEVTGTLHDLIIEGIFTGVGSVLSFLPIIVTLFFFLSMLEDSGYIARVAFFMDKLLRKLGLSGRSIVPLLIGFGCTVPAVMSTRTLPSERDRKMTILLTPFMSCTAKLPIYAFFVDVFFPENSALIMTGLYLGAICVGILVALLFKNTLFKGEAVPFVMELPNYRLPSAGNVVRLLWEKAQDFLQRAFTVIFLATIIVWFLQSFDLQLNATEDTGKSILAVLAGGIAPLFAPLGLGDWRICVSLLTGIMAKESVVSSLNVLFGSSEAVRAALTATAAATLLSFTLLYSPCIAALASVKRELGARNAVLVALWQCLIAWLVAFVVHGVLAL